MSKVVSTAFKAALLASSLLCLALIAIENKIGFAIIPIYFISTIITFLIAMTMVIITIVPFHTFDDTLNAKQKFNRYFPFYAMVYFLTCFSISFSSNFNVFVSLILLITYITAMKAWLWFFKQKTTTS